MKTRTLLLLAIGCGLAILIAGGIQLLRLGGQDQSSTLLAAGQVGTAGDVSVTLVSAAPVATGDELTVDVRIGGTDDADGLDGFTLVGPGKVAAVASSTCDGITPDVRSCTLRFSTAGMTGSSRQLLFRRADEQLRWIIGLDD
jgi:hypothetical protein